MTRIRFYLCLFPLVILSCSFNHQGNHKKKKNSLHLKKQFQNKLPMNFLFHSAPHSIGILKKNGNIIPHSTQKDQAIRVEDGHWEIKQDQLHIKARIFNAYSCETEDCNPYHKNTFKISIKVSNQGEIVLKEVSNIEASKLNEDPSIKKKIYALKKDIKRLKE